MTEMVWMILLLSIIKITIIINLIKETNYPNLIIDLIFVK